MTAASGPDWFLSYADVPSVMRMADGTLVAQWGENIPEGFDAYNLQLSYSKDDGETWAPPFMPHDDGTATQHGFTCPYQKLGTCCSRCSYGQGLIRSAPA